MSARCNWCSTTRKPKGGWWHGHRGRYCSVIHRDLGDVIGQVQESNRRKATA